MTPPAHPGRVCSQGGEALGEKQFEDPAHYAVPSAGVTWGSLLK